MKPRTILAAALWAILILLPACRKEDAQSPPANDDQSHEDAPQIAPPPAPPQLAPEVMAGQGDNEPSDKTHRTGRILPRLRIRTNRLALLIEAGKQSLKLAAERIRQDPEMLMSMADMAMSKGEYALAREYYKSACELDSTNIDLLQGLAVATVARGDHQASIDVYRKILAICPMERTTMFNLSVAQARLGLLEDSRQTLWDLVREHGDFIEARFNLATLCQKQGRLSEARDQWREVIRLAPNLSHPYAMLGDVSSDLGDHSSAADAYAQYASRHRDDFEAQYNAAISAARADRLSQAAVNTRRALNLNPDSAKANLLMGEIYYAAWRASGNEQHLVDAIASAGKAVHLDGDNEFAQDFLERLVETRASLHRPAGQ